MTDAEIERLFAEPRFALKRCLLCGALIGGFMSSNEWVRELAAHMVRHGTVQTAKINDFEAPLV